LETPRTPITTDLNCTEPGAEVSLIGNFVTSIKKCMREAGLEALPVPVESLRLRVRLRNNSLYLVWLTMQ